MIAIMQPYLFPYLGYFQLIMASDTFVLFDDVNYIKKGYINRNNILLNGAAYRFTIPVQNVSQNKKINEHYFSDDTENLLKTFNMAYAKAPYYMDIYPIIERALKGTEKKVSSVCFNAINDILDYLGIEKNIVFSSNIAYDRCASATDKVIDITKALGSNYYINAIGGQNLYEYDYFKSKDVTLAFIQMSDIVYSQEGKNVEFIPNLSILDALMWSSPKNVLEMLTKYTLITKEYNNGE
ncbi:WbqC family protein [Citrobacter amalonaticus]|nr:WbqC family protein [Citrobacter amalonaticus]HAT3923360.1 WbqC family protein [Citrobacter amalonaticus]